MARQIGTFSTLEPLQRLEDFPTFVSAIKSFGKPILPLLMTLEIRNEISELRTAAVNREAVMLKRRKERLNHFVKEKNVFKNFEDQSDVNNEGTSCVSKASGDAPSALSEMCQDHFSVHNRTFVAMSKLSTKDIFSTVHKNVIVCPNVMKGRPIENDVTFDNDSDLNVGAMSCLVCNQIDCESYQSDSNYTRESNSFPVDISSVPFADFYENKTTVSDDEQSSIIAETECGSLPTVIYNHGLPTHDTDSESNVTSITQSTDLEKYMVSNSSADYYSSEDTVNWGSKTFSQETTGSTSDCTSSDTLINTENELTPCASVVAELNPYVEDTLSTVSEIKSSASNEENSVNIKRAHSVDSYMKLLKSYKQNLNIKTSKSDPSHKNSQDLSCRTENYLQNCDETANKQDTNISSIENEYGFELNNDNYHSCSSSLVEDSISVIESNEESSTGRRHIRRNSYTLDQPSPVLVKALEDPFCNLGIEPNSHNSTVNLESKVSSAKVAAFLKEKIDVNASLSPAKAKKLSVAGVKTLTDNQNLYFVNKSDSLNAVEKKITESERCSKCYEESQDPTEMSSGGKEVEALQNNLGNMATMESYFVETSSEDILSKAYQLIQENQKVKVQNLLEEQNRQWLQLQEDLKKEELSIYEQLKHLAQSSVGTESKQCIPENSKFDGHNASKIISKQDKSSVLEQNSAFCLPLCASENDVNLSAPFPDGFSVSIKHLTDETQNSHPEKEYSDQLLCYTFSKLSQNDAVNSESFAREVLTRNFTPENISAETDSIDTNMQCHPVPNASNILKPTEDCFSVDSEKEKEQESQLKYQTVNENHSDAFSDINEHGDSMSAYSCCSKLSSSPPVLNGHVESLNMKSDCNQFESGTYSNDQVKAQQESQNTSRSALKSNGTENDLKNVSKSKFPSVATRPTLKKTSALASKNKGRVITDNPALVKKFEKLPAFVKGHLTRRLLKTERVKNLMKTLKDTALLIGKLSEDLTLKVDSISPNDAEFHRQLIVQLMTTFHNIYDIFCTISVKERMNIIAENRTLLLKQNPTEPTAVAVPSVLPVVPSNLPNKKKKLSAATIKSLERKKSKSSIDSRTYTVSDFQRCKMRPHSNPTIKSHSVSPSRICKRSVAVSPKRKSASPRKSSHRLTMNLK